MKDRYDHKKIEKKWQREWEKKKIYRTLDPIKDAKKISTKQKFYVLDMFPYPSGEGLHVGHPKGYIATDIVSRMKRMQGFNVLHPMGFDAFGLPAEQYAIKMKTNPAIAVAKNVARYKKQLEILGLDYDWSREVNTTDPTFYKWTQWIFLKLLEKGLAYESYEPINWCPTCKTGLANEDLEDGKCERCGTPVEKKPMRQWVLKITDYADRLLADLDATDYVIPSVVDHVNPPRKDKKDVVRKNVHAIVYDPKNEKYLILRNSKHGWDTVIIGGVEDGESYEQAARRELEEETGYVDLEFKRQLGGVVKASYFAKHKDVNRVAYSTGLYFELKSDKQVPVATDGDNEGNEITWVDEKDFVPGKMVNSELPIWLERINDPEKGWGKPLLDWPESIKEAQRNWIGRSEGAEFNFVIKDSDEKITVFTTRADTIYGVTYVVLAPEHELVHKLAVQNKKEVDAYVAKAKAKTEIERTDAKKQKTGVQLKGIKAINPANGEEVPVWVADYVLADYGTGAVMAVPAHDERDAEFSKVYDLPVKKIELEDKNKVTEKFGKKVVKYKLRDWVFSRQRYWGEPIPVYHTPDGKIVPVLEKELPVELPKVTSYEPTGTGESPLAAISKWVNVQVKTKEGKEIWKRETNTMPQWAGSSWYYLRYMDPKNSKGIVDSKKETYWNQTDLYVGGAEHATRHLIYARFWHKFLYDLDVVSTIEPFKKLQNVGLIMAEDGRKMSKRWGNVVNPDEIIETYGADTMRLYEMFMGPFDQAIAWNTQSMIGSRRFIERLWNMQDKVVKAEIDLPNDVTTLLHQTIKKVGDDIESLGFNTAISAMMILLNRLEKEEKVSQKVYETILKLIAPFAPHIADELWKRHGGKGSIHVSEWPQYDSSKLQTDLVTVAIQVNGKVRGSIECSRSDSKEAILQAAKNESNILKWIEGKNIRKEIYVPGKLVSLVVD